MLSSEGSPAHSCCRDAPDSREAVSAFAKHIVLKAPDKAESRSVASESAITLIQNLPAEDQYQFVVFVACLSRSSKVRRFCRLVHHFALTKILLRLPCDLVLSQFSKKTKKLLDLPKQNP